MKMKARISQRITARRKLGIEGVILDGVDWYDEEFPFMRLEFSRLFSEINASPL